MVISVVMAAYNGEKYIREQINSILNQTVKPDEIIICDDASQDTTDQIISDYQQDYPNIVKVIKNEDNLGYKYSFWRAIQSATGDIIFLSDQDDIWHPDKVQAVKEQLINNPDILALSSGYELIDANGVVYQDYRNVHFKNDHSLSNIHWKKFVRHPKYPGMAMAIRKELIAKIPERCKTMHEYIPPHDWTINLFAALSEKMYLYDHILSGYRQHENNVVGSSARNHMENPIQNRVNTLSEISKSMEVVLPDLSECESKYLQKLKHTYDKRIKYTKNHQIIQLFLCDLSKLRFISLRGVLGDLYYCVKFRKKQ